MTRVEMSERRVVVVGAGAGGLMAASRAAEMGAEVLLLEKMEQPGRKLLISGRARCNLTNARELDDFIAMYGPNGRFLYRAFNRFFRPELLALLAKYGVRTSQEPDGRIFPASGDARDVLAALQRYAGPGRVKLLNGSKVTSIEAAGGAVKGVSTGDGVFPAGAVILATGGASYPGTGSTGDGYRMAAGLGHSIVELRPALVPLKVRQEDLARSLQGLSLSGVRMTSFRGPAAHIDPNTRLRGQWGRGLGPGKPPAGVIESRIGDMVFTHFGVSGPLILLLSLGIVDALKEGPVSVAMDMEPASSHEEIDIRTRQVLEAHGRRTYRTIIKEMLPPKIIEPFLELTGIPPGKPANQISAGEREITVQTLKCLRLDIAGPLPLASATVTAGGVALDEIDPYTMESRLVRGLFFCGEVMNLDADTGGYNLQAAFSTGYVAGEQAATGTGEAGR